MATRLHAGTETGSLVNHLQSGMNSAEPEFGIGCTILGWTDRQAATVVEVGKNFVIVQADRAIRTDGNGVSECQSYLFERNPDGGRYTFKRSRCGAWKEAWVGESGRLCTGGGGRRLMIGHRDHYHDFSF